LLKKKTKGELSPSWRLWNKIYWKMASIFWRYYWWRWSNS